MMKSFLFSALLFVLVLGGCAHAPSAARPPLSLDAAPAMAASNPEPSPPQTPAVAASGPALNSSPPSALPVNDEKKGPDAEDDLGDIDAVEETDEEKPVTIADPLESFNRAMYHFNDKLYFWVLKPAAQGYKKVVPEEARIGVRNFFTNLAFPIRFVNCLLQADLGGATTELGRFILNTVWGFGGLFDSASVEGVNLPKQEKDLGQTLGVYGVGQGFFINWPILGPSSTRETIGFIGDLFLYPVTYVDFGYVSIGVDAFDKVNDVSFRIGDYEAVKEAAIDPYMALRDAYVQYRTNKVKKAGQKK